MQEYAYLDQTVFINTNKGYVTSEKKLGKYRRIIQNILRIIQECPYPDQNILIKTHKGYVTRNNKNGQNHKKRAKQVRFCQNAHLNRHARSKRATSLHRCTFLGLYLLV